MTHRLPFAFAVSILTLSLALPSAAQEGCGRTEGCIHIPDSSLEHPGDAGVQAHTNLSVLLAPEGGLGQSGVMTPAQMRGFYGVKGYGSGAIAVVDAYAYPNAQNDFNKFCQQYGLPSSRLQVRYPYGVPTKTDPGWNLETALDTQWIHAMAPYATIYLVLAKSSNFSDLLDAVWYAQYYLPVQQVTMCWGSGEFQGELAYDSYFFNYGPVLFAAAGDSGGPLWPAASPRVVAVGGTTVTTNAAGKLTMESAWADGGGGPSAYETKPYWQNGLVPATYRGLPDVSCDGDPNTGASVYLSTPYPTGTGYKTGWFVVGGTSLSTACMAAMDNASGYLDSGTIPFLRSIYSHPTAFRDITSGSAGPNAAGPGWDFATGLGVPNGPGSF
ncbi:MAG: S53 family peptidase [Holophaga sp.]|jgi:subtilase family serine protease